MSASQQTTPRHSTSDPSPGAFDHDLEKQHSDTNGSNEDESPASAVKEQGGPTAPIDPNLVVLEGPDDPINPQNIPPKTKWLYAVLLGAITLCVTFSSSVFSTAIAATAEEFNVSTTVTSLGVSLFVFGFATGPILYGPLSELYGRKTPLFVGYACFVIFQIPEAVGQNMATIMISRYLQGVFAAGSPAIIGGYLADFFDPVNRGLAVAVFASTTMIGPILGPVLGGFITESHLGWRWTAWITMIMAGTCGLIAAWFVPETFLPVLLKRKAQRLRYETKNWALHAKIEETPVDLRGFVVRYLARPMTMLVQDPILSLSTAYLSFVYGFIYLLFEAYPVSFIDERGWTLGVGGLPFLSIGVGILCGSVYILWYTKTTIQSNFVKYGHVKPEDRIYPAIWGAISLPIGLFWFAWTSYPSISPWPQIIAGIPIGAGIYIIFMQVLAYYVDIYMVNANSAISANTIVRSLVAGGFPLFATAMYKNLGVQWASSLLGFLALAFAPMPIFFYVYGERIRKLSKYSPQM